MLIYDDQINMKNDLANGGELLKELLNVTGDQATASEIQKLTDIMKDETMQGLAAVNLGGQNARSQNLEIIREYAEGERTDF